MPKFEKIPKEVFDEDAVTKEFIRPGAREGQNIEISSQELWDDVLALFGTEEARERFKKLCQRYYEYLVKAKAMRGMDDQAIESSETSRARIHNQIMTIIYSLMTQTRLSSEQKRRFNKLSDRKEVAKMVEDILGPHSEREQKKMERMTELGRFRKEEF